MKKILVGVDGSKRARSVLEAAVRLAKQTKSDLVLIRAVGLPTELPREALSISPSDVAGMLEARAKNEVAKLAAEVDKDLAVKIRIELGSPWQTVCRVAHEENVEVIIIGTHGYDALDHVLGTTAARIVNHADRSVLVVRGRAGSPPAP